MFIDTGDLHRSATLERHPTDKERRSFVEMFLESSRDLLLDVRVIVLDSAWFRGGCSCDEGYHGESLANGEHPYEWHFAFEALVEARHPHPNVWGFTTMSKTRNRYGGSKNMIIFRSFVCFPPGPLVLSNLTLWLLRDLVESSVAGAYMLTYSSALLACV